MRVENNSKQSIYGTIIFTVVNPSGKKNKIKDDVFIKKLTKIDKYYQYKVRKNTKAGRYLIDGRFIYPEGQVGSETYKTDYFDVVYE